MAADVAISTTPAASATEPESRPRWPVTRSLAVVELHQLVTNAGFLGGLGFIGLFIFLTTGTAFLSPEQGGEDHRLALLVVGLAVGLLVATLLGANTSALRTHRGRTGELLDSLPAPRATRTIALAAAIALGPAVAILGLTIAGGLAWGSEFRGVTEAGFIAQMPLATIALGTLGIALARWIRHPIAGPAAVVLMVMTPLIWAVPWIASSTSGIKVGWHLAYLASSLSLFVSLSLAGDRRGFGSRALVRALIVPAMLLVAVVVCAVEQGQLQ
jgi:hypothetical protein